MTRLEKVAEYAYQGITISEGKAVVVGIDGRGRVMCPYKLGCGLDSQDIKTTAYAGTLVIGCRGMTCKECWNKEFEG